MNPTDQQSKFSIFRDLHNRPGIFVLPNAWDVASARIFVDAGFSAIGTTSAGIAVSLGYADGQRVSRELMLEVVARIAASVRIPVTADMEAGYGQSIDDAVLTAKGVLAAGAVGMNFEDAAPDSGGTRELMPVELQVERIKAIRQSAPAVLINARTDVYLAQTGDSSSRFERAVERANAYRAAGADCLFAPGVRDTATIAALVRAIDGPLNVLAVPGSPAVPKLEELGVKRVSVGSGPMRATLALVRRIALELRDSGTYSAFAGAIPHADVNKMFTARGN